MCTTTNKIKTSGSTHTLVGQKVSTEVLSINSFKMNIRGPSTILNEKQNEVPVLGPHLDLGPHLEGVLSSGIPQLTLPTNTHTHTHTHIHTHIHTHTCRTCQVRSLTEHLPNEVPSFYRLFSIHMIQKCCLSRHY